MSNPVLYILMRNDLESMNAGKAIAQGAHAANQFVQEIEGVEPSNASLYSLYKDWCCSTSMGFGTTIVLGASIEEIKDVIEKLEKDSSCLCGITFDPTYPLRDGDVTHLLPLDTCAYVFTDKDADSGVWYALDNLELYP